MNHDSFLGSETMSNSSQTVDVNRMQQLMSSSPVPSL
jgi:hypothetical protein